MDLTGRVYFTHILRRLIVMTACLSLISCGVGSRPDNHLDIGSGELKIEFPPSLNKHVSESMLLKATISVDGRDTSALVVDRVTRSVKGRIKDITNGEHYLVVEFFIVDQGNDVSIAKGGIQINVDGAQVLEIQFEAFVYLDGDKDGITNIAEIGIGTNYSDPNSKPDADNVHASENYFMLDNSMSESVSYGNAKSDNYEIN